MGVQAIVVSPFTEVIVRRLPLGVRAALQTERENFTRVLVLREILTKLVDDVHLCTDANSDGAQVVSGVAHDEVGKEIERPQIALQPPGRHVPKARWSREADYLAEGVCLEGCEQYNHRLSQVAQAN